MAEKKNGQSMDETLKAVFRQAFLHRWWVFIAFVTVSFSMISLGVIWPKVYTSGASILAQGKTIMGPLMQGTAVETNLMDSTRVAREALFSRRSMMQIAQHGGWLDSNPSELEAEAITKGIRSRTMIKQKGEQLINIEYKDSDPERAYKVTDKLVDLFIAESLRNKARESQTAFQFIDRQVSEYQLKLKAAEQRLKEYRERNPDARQGVKVEVNARIRELVSRIEGAELAVKEAEIRKASIQAQIQEEARKTKLNGDDPAAVPTHREILFRTKLDQLQSRLDEMRLRYHDTYPEVLQLEQQIKEVEAAITGERRRERDARALAMEQGRPYNPQGAATGPVSAYDTLYHSLRRQLSETETEIATLRTRQREFQRLLAEEGTRAQNINSLDAEVASLTRDYEVNRDIYRDLLRRRESARVSMNLDEEQHSLNLMVQEPPYVPLSPTGPRFIHFMLGGLIMGLMVPFGLIFALMAVDGKIRANSVLAEELELNLLATVPHLPIPEERRRTVRSLQILGVMSVIALAAYIGLAVMKIGGVFDAG